MRKSRAHLRNGEDQAQVHDRDDGAGNQHAAPAAGREAEVPAREVPRDDRSDAKSPKRPDARIALKPARLEIRVAYLFIGNARNVRFLHDIPSDLLLRPNATVFQGQGTGHVLLWANNSVRRRPRMPYPRAPHLPYPAPIPPRYEGCAHEASRVALGREQVEGVAERGCCFEARRVAPGEIPGANRKAHARVCRKS